MRASLFLTLGLVDLSQHAAQRIGQFLAVLEPPVGRLGQAALDHATQCSGQVRTELLDRNWVFARHIHRQRHQAVAQERSLAGEHLIQQDAGSCF